MLAMLARGAAAAGKSLMRSLVTKAADAHDARLGRCAWAGAVGARSRG